MRASVAVHLAEAEAILVVQDHLSPHSPAARYSVFPPEVKRSWERREFHDTPTQGSWLTRAGLERRRLSRPCRKRRLPDQPTLTYEVTAWQARRHHARHR